jgi:hypothetical protein
LSPFFANADRDAVAQAPITDSNDPGQWALLYTDVINKNRESLTDPPKAIGRMPMLLFKRKIVPQQKLVFFPVLLSK